MQLQKKAGTELRNNGWTLGKISKKLPLFHFYQKYSGSYLVFACLIKRKESLIWTMIKMFDEHCLLAFLGAIRFWEFEKEN